jgi:hypothetical protein
MGEMRIVCKIVIWKISREETTWLGVDAQAILYWLLER